MWYVATMRAFSKLVIEMEFARLFSLKLVSMLLSSYHFLLPHLHFSMPLRLFSVSHAVPSDRWRQHVIMVQITQIKTYSLDLIKFFDVDFC